MAKGKHRPRLCGKAINGRYGENRKGYEIGHNMLETVNRFMNMTFVGFICAFSLSPGIPDSTDDKLAQETLKLGVHIKSLK